MTLPGKLVQRLRRKPQLQWLEIAPIMTYEMMLRRYYDDSALGGVDQQTFLSEEIWPVDL